MIYLARNGKCFGPFHADELTPKLLAEYSWIFDLRDAPAGWQPIDPKPVQLPSQDEAGSVEALAVTRQAGRAVTGQLQAVRLRSGLLVTQEPSIRLEPGSSIELLVGGKKPILARVDEVEFDEQKARYRLSWSASNAPG
jgi:hypothetical protein